MHRVFSRPYGPRDVVVLCVCIGILFGIMLGNRPLGAPDEARYSEIAREMVETGDYVTPRLNGVKYFEKPVLFYWLQAASIQLFGLREWALRVWTALFGLIGCLAVYAAGDALFGRRSGWLAATVLATSVMYYGMSHVVTLDMAVSVWISLGLLAFLLGTRMPPGWPRRFYLYAFYLCCALAVLTKGLIGIVLPGLIISLWIALRRDWRLLKTLYLPSGTLLFLAVAVPWHIMVSIANPEFPRFYFIHEHLDRYLTKVHQRYRPPWFFLPILLIGLFPWTVFLIQALRQRFPTTLKQCEEQKDKLFLLCWAGVVLLFFSLSSSKLIPYILPAFPPLALLIGNYLSCVWDQPRSKELSAAYIGLLVLSGVFVAGVFIPAYIRPGLESPEVRLHLYAMAAVLGAGTAAAFFLGRGRGPSAAIPVLTITAALFLVGLISTAPLLDKRTAKNVALALKPKLGAADEVVVYRAYYQDLPFYLERRITVVGWKGELKFGTEVEDASAWMIGEAELWRRWGRANTVYMLTTRKAYEDIRQAGKKAYVVMSDQNNVLLRNTPTVAMRLANPHF